MQASNAPSKSAVPFAERGTKNTIPVESQIGVTPGLASFTDGFPPLTMTPLAAGGVPPYGADVNGILNFLSAAVRWVQAGGSYGYDSAFATSVGGYPKGAVLLANDNLSLWVSLVDANVEDFNGGTPTKWARIAFSGLDARLNTKADKAGLDALLNTKADKAGLDALLNTKADKAGLDARLNTKADKAVAINAGTGLSGGGTLEASRTLSVSYGTTAGTSAQGNDSRITDAAQKSANLSDLTSPATARSNLGLGSAAVLNTGGWKNTVCQNDKTISPAGIEIGALRDSEGAAHLDFNTKFPAGDFDARIIKGGIPKILEIINTEGNIVLLPQGAGSEARVGANRILTTADDKGNFGIGVGQTWWDVTASRFVGITYTNTTGRSIQLFITFDPARDAVHFSINGVNILPTEDVSHYHVACIVPAGSTYRMDSPLGSNVQMKWMELR